MALAITGSRGWLPQMTKEVLCFGNFKCDLVILVNSKYVKCNVFIIADPQNLWDTREFFKPLNFCKPILHATTKILLYLYSIRSIINNTVRLSKQDIK